MTKEKPKSVLYWDESSIRSVAHMFKTRTDFNKAYSYGYKVACKIPGLLDELFGNQKFVWSKDALIAEASKYATKSEFKDGHQGAYVACHSKFPGLMDDLFADQIRYWKDEADVREEAMKYESRSAFRFGTPGASKSAVAKFPHVLDEVFGPKLLVPWVLEDLIKKAGEFGSRVEFQEKAGGAYNAFRRFPGELDKIFPLKYRFWSDEIDIRAEASKYRTKADFVYGCVSAYGAALDLGIIDDLGFEPGDSGFDTTAPSYFYVAEIALTDRKDGILFGITNRTPGTRYTLWEQAHMGSKMCYRFERGADALRLETSMRQQFMKHAVVKGQSPLRDKSGTAGEMLSGIPLDVVRSAMSVQCPHLPTCETW